MSKDAPASTDPGTQSILHTDEPGLIHATLPQMFRIMISSSPSSPQPTSSIPVPAPSSLASSSFGAAIVHVTADGMVTGSALARTSGFVFAAVNALSLFAETMVVRGVPSVADDRWVSDAEDLACSWKELRLSPPSPCRIRRTLCFPSPSIPNVSSGCAPMAPYPRRRRRDVIILVGRTPCAAEKGDVDSRLAYCGARPAAGRATGCEPGLETLVRGVARKSQQCGRNPQAALSLNVEACSFGYDWVWRCEKLRTSLRPSGTRSSLGRRFPVQEKVAPCRRAGDQRQMGEVGDAVLDGGARFAGDGKAEPTVMLAEESPVSLHPSRPVGSEVVAGGGKGDEKAKVEDGEQECEAAHARGARFARDVWAGSYCGAPSMSREGFFAKPQARGGGL
ncbi:hypothetical protein MVEN_00929600 [Mycena venus]|uniref:Uncharacterized protein n=1 Tax=Mycena venus TaxID=2733690 RepID=A0A8H6YCL1_9AGAR|nr:hypothetical protein MVEN_00929600 [Mycena venus]